MKRGGRQLSLFPPRVSDADVPDGNSCTLSLRPFALDPLLDEITLWFENGTIFLPSER